MADKSKHAQTLLAKALNELQDNSFNAVRHSIKKAINEISRIQKKRTKRADQQKEQPTMLSQWNDAINAGLTSPFNAKQTLEILNKMQEEELKKLNKKKETDDDDVETILD